MHAIFQFVMDHQLAIYVGFGAVVSMLPPPNENERWYGFTYNVLHLAASNVAKVFPSLRIERK